MKRQPPVPYYIVDAFADRPFTGNPAAVIPLMAWKFDEWLQNVAMEMNLSETAFFTSAENGFHIRWFTPTVEVDLCGHATLATAKVISHLGLVEPGEEITFKSRSGKLMAQVASDQIELDFPLKPELAAPIPAGLVEAIGVTPQYVGKSDFDYLVELKSENAVRMLNPDFRRLAGIDCRGVIITALSDDPRFDFVSRFFAPGDGIDEDPVTGSAHCCLADFWRKRLAKTEFVAYQASARGGIVNVKVLGDRVRLGGNAIIVAHGHYCFEA